MNLREIEIVNFRNLRDARIELPDEGSFLVGRNGQGKTNFLEAVYYLGTMRSFRTKRDTELVRFGERYFRIRGVVEKSGGEGQVEISYDGRRKSVKVDGLRTERLKDAFGVVKVVAVIPEDVEIVSSSPTRRRRFMDIVMSMTSVSYLDVLTNYYRVLRQRNTLLREGGGGEGVLSAWDDQLAGLAGAVAVRRKKFIDEFEAYYREAHRAIDEERESGLRYVTSPRRATEALEVGEEPASLYREALSRTVSRDRELGTTSVGPHRDNIAFELGGNDLRTYGSQGQMRTGVFSLKVAEAAFIEARTEERPIILLDDVLSQLDRERGGRLMDLLGGRFQMIVTTPRKEDISRMPERIEKWWVERGALSPM